MSLGHITFNVELDLARLPSAAVRYFLPFTKKKRELFKAFLHTFVQPQQQPHTEHITTEKEEEEGYVVQTHRAQLVRGPRVT